jgi:hypothetical protein
MDKKHHSTGILMQRSGCFDKTKGNGGEDNLRNSYYRTRTKKNYMVICCIMPMNLYEEHYLKVNKYTICC